MGVRSTLSDRNYSSNGALSNVLAINDFDLYYVTVLWQVQPQIKKLKPKISIRCKTALSNSNWTKASKYLKEYMLSAVIIYEVKQHCSAKSRHNTARSTHDAAWAVSPLHPALICTILDSFYWYTDFKMIFWFHFHKLRYARYRLSIVSIIAV